MDNERRGFLGKVLALGVGLAAVVKGARSWAKGLPSDPGARASAGSGQDVIVLPQFEKDSSFTLHQALLQRKTERSYDPDKPLTRDEISRVLWACCGQNRPDGHLTTPSAVASYPVDVMVAIPEGVYMFEPRKHRLVKVLDQDIRKQIPIQPGLRKAGITLLYLINNRRFQDVETNMRWGDLEIGCMVQNVYLEAAAQGKSCVVFALVKYEKVTELLGLKKNQVLRIAQAVANPR